MRKIISVILVVVMASIGFSAHAFASAEDLVDVVLYISTQTTAYDDAREFITSVLGFKITNISNNDGWIYYMNADRSDPVHNISMLYNAETNNVHTISFFIEGGKESYNAITNALNEEFGDCFKTTYTAYTGERVETIGWKHGGMSIRVDIPNGQNLKNVISGESDFTIHVENPTSTKLKSDNKFIKQDSINQPELNDKTFTIRNGITFGMSIQDVIGIEGTPVKTEETGKRIQYKTTASGKPATMLMTFNEDSLLWSIGYIFTDSHTNPDLYIEDYTNLNSALKDKYGEPAHSVTNWTNDIYEYLFSSVPGSALSLGYVSYASQWVIGEVSILHGVIGENFFVHHALYYSCDSFKPSSEESQNYDGI